MRRNVPRLPAFRRGSRRRLKNFGRRQARLGRERGAVREPKRLIPPEGPLLTPLGHTGRNFEGPHSSRQLIAWQIGLR